MRVTLKDGSYREDIGYGTAENVVPSVALANGKKAAVTDALKRYVETFERSLLNEKGYVS